MTSVQLYDTTLRDGCQAEDINFTLEDKLRIAERLDGFGIDYIEGGWPGSNPRDAASSRRCAAHAPPAEDRRLRLDAPRTASRCDEDQNLRMLLEAETPVVTIVGRPGTCHVDATICASRSTRTST